MKTYNIAIGRKFVIKIFALKNFKIIIHQYQIHPKSRKIDSSRQVIFIRHNSSDK